MDVELALINVRDIIVLEIQYALGMLNNGRWVRGQEVLDGLGKTVFGEEGPGLSASDFGMRGIRWSKNLGIVFRDCIVLQMSKLIKY